VVVAEFYTPKIGRSTRDHYELFLWACSHKIQIIIKKIKLFASGLIWRPLNGEKPRPLEKVGKRSSSLNNWKRGKKLASKEHDCWQLQGSMEHYRERGL
jgi:hypothetical protein